MKGLNDRKLIGKSFKIGSILSRDAMVKQRLAEQQEDFPTDAGERGHQDKK